MSIETKPTEAPPHDGLCDEQGPIPMFPPRALDKQGRMIPLSPEEDAARRDAAIRCIKAIRQRPDTDPPDIMKEVFRDMDANRPPGQKLFEGLGLY